MIRGLSPYPAAFTEFHGKKLKVYTTSISADAATTPGLIEIVGKDKLRAHCADRILDILEVQYEGKKRMPVRDFLNGFKTI